MTTKKYSLRKVKVGVASVLVGLGVATTGAVVAHAEGAATPAATTPAEGPAAAAAPEEETPVEKLQPNTPALTSEEIDALNNSLDEAKRDLKKEEAEAKKQLLADYDKSLEDLVKDVENFKPTTPEEEKAQKESIAKLRAAAAESKAEIEELFKAGLTAEEAEKALKEAGKPVTNVFTEDTLPADVLTKIQDAEDAAKEEEALLPTSVKKQELLDELEKQIDRDKKQVEGILEEAQEKATTVNLLTKELEEATAQLKAVEALKDVEPEAAAKINSLKTKVAELEAKLESATNAYNAHSEKAKAVLESLKNEINELTDEYNYALGEYHLAKVAELTDQIATLEENIKNATDKDLKAILEKDLADLKADLAKATKEMEDVLNVIDPLVLPEKQNPGLGSVTPGDVFGQKPEVKEEAKAEEVKTGLPNTGMNSTSTAALGLSLIALVGLAVRRKLNN